MDPDDKNTPRSPVDQKDVKFSNVVNQVQHGWLQNFWYKIGRDHDQIMVVLGILGFISVVFGGGLALWKIFDDIDKEEIARARDDAALYWNTESEIYDARLLLEKYWAQPQVLEELDALDREDWPRLAAERVKLQGHEDAVTILHSFYVAVAQCALDGRCDNDISCENFSKDIYDFKFLYGDVLRERSDKIRRSLTLELKKFAEDMCGERSADVARPKRRRVRPARRPPPGRRARPGDRRTAAAARRR